MPDVKTVRTNFVVNVAAGTLALALLMVVGWREYQISLYNTQRVAAEAEVERYRRGSNEGLRLTRLLNDEARKFAEAAAFVEAPIAVSELLTVLGASLPPDIQLESVDFRPGDPTAARAFIRGVAAGAKDQASGAASAYVEVLRTQPRLTEVFDNVKLNAINPDPNSSALLFEIELRYKQKGAKK